MQFLFPSFLWGLLALAIPIIIHLFHFRRFKKVYFTNVRFLKEVKEETSARSRLRNLLVLLMRLLAMALLIFAFAQPFIPKGEAVEKGNKAVSVYIDNSFSMEALSEDIALLEKAKNRAKAIVGAYQEEDLFQIITNDFEGRHQRMVNKENALSLIDEVKVSPTVRQLDQVFNRQQQALESSNLNQQITYELSDFQSGIAQSIANWQDTSIAVNLIPLQAVQENNLSIDSAWFESPVQLLNQSNQLLVKITNWGSNIAENIRLSAAYNNQNKPIGTLSIPAGESVIDTAQIPVLKTGWQEVTLTITDFPVSFDDNYYLSFEVAEQIKMLSINETTPNRYLDAAFNQTAYFQMDNQAAASLNYSSFSDYQLIVLNDLINISSGLASELSKYAQNGGNILVFPASNANIESYNTLLNVFAANQLLNFEQQSRAVGGLNTDEFIFKDVFERSSNNLKFPTTQGNYKLSQFTNRKQETLASYRDGSPYLVKYASEQGNFYLCAAPLAENVNDLVRNGEIFVPMILKMAIASNKNAKIAYTIGKDEIIEATHQVGSTDQAYKIGNTQKEFIPEQRIIGADVILGLNSQIQEAGFYNLYLNAGEQLAQYGFNFDRTESNLACLKTEELAQLTANNSKINIIESTAKADFTRLIGERSQGIVLWRWCLILALIFLALETLLLRFWKV